ncbi:MAG TPA: MerR family transcriptional regulator [Actinomycetota bacterium]|nr:MerR family transcriptional regulator [Actinomycetota bacterium]
MPLSRSRDYLSIGEVLDQIRPDFPDVSISKIRFLEAEGLINPKRTDSGYRMFYDGDLARLRYILELQRDHFLPLKVIRERLQDVDSNGGVIPAVAAPAPTPAKSKRNGSAAPVATSASLSRSELLKASGLDEARLRELEEFGIVAAGDAGTYDENDLVVASAARRFFEFGVQARHLKMYRQFADREAAFFEQIVTPVARRRDPAAQGEAGRSLQELAALSRQMREATLNAMLRELL